MDEEQVFAKIVEDRERTPRRRTLEWSVSLAGLALIVLVVVALVPHGSGFDGVWLKSSGEAWMPEEIKVAVHDGVLSETLPGAAEYQTYRLIADGREHEWDRPDVRSSRWRKFYTARLETGGFVLTTEVRDVSGPAKSGETERWRLNGSDELRIADRSGETVYLRASLFKRLLRREP